MTPLATLADLAAVGGVPVGTTADADEGARGERLLTMASASVLTFLDGFGVTEVKILGAEATEDDEAIPAEWEDFRRESLAAIVAEVAAKRMTISAAPSVDPFMTQSGPQTIKLNRWEKHAIRELIPANDDDELAWAEP